MHGKLLEAYAISLTAWQEIQKIENEQSFTSCKTHKKNQFIKISQSYFRDKMQNIHTLEMQLQKYQT